MWVFLLRMRNLFLGFKGQLCESKCIWMYVNCKWPIMELLLEWKNDITFVVLGHCYYWILLLQKNTAYIGHHHPINVKIVRLCPLTTMSSDKNQKGHTTKTKERQNNTTAIPTQGKNHWFDEQRSKYNCKSY